MSDFTSLYSEKVMDHFQHPRNVGEMADADGVGTVGNKVCGDVMRLFIKVTRVPPSFVPNGSGLRKGKQVSEVSEGRVPRVPRVPKVSEVSKVLQVSEGAGEETEIISEVKFQTLGCGAAIATSSIATEMIKGKPLSEAVEITNKAIAEALDGLPPAKMHCSVLAANAVKKAVEDYRSKKR